jgi:hypothetical protein
MAVGAAAWLCVAIALADDLSVRTQTRSGKAYEGEHLSGSNWPAPLYFVSLVTEKGPGVDRLRTSSTDPRGRSFFSQTVDFDGDSPKAYAFSNSVVGQEGKLTVTPSELAMELTEHGRTRTAREPRPPLFAVGPSINRLVEGHLSEIAAGQSISFRMVVVNRLQTFAVRIIRESADAGEPIAQVKSGQWMRLRIEAESPVARLFAPKVLTIVDTRTGQTLFLSAPLPSPDPGVGTLDRGTIHYD